jgi:NitT/TauT family transport system substrate-binding protein
MQNITKTLMIIVIFSMLTACGAPAPERPPLRVEYSTWWGDYTIAVADSLGLFDKYGVNVETNHYDVYSDSFADMAADKIDVGLYGIGETLTLSSIASIKMVGIYDNGGFNTLISSPDIRSINDLQGKRIGVLAGTVYELFVIQALSTAGLTAEDVTLVNLAPEEVLAELPNNIQAAYTWEPATTEALAAGYKILYDSDKLTDFNAPDGIVFRAAIVQERPDDVRAFLKAWYEAVDYRLANPEKSRQLIADYMKIPVDQIVPDDNLKLYTLADNQSFFKRQGSDQRSDINKAAESIAEYFIRSGILTGNPDFNELFDPSFLN